MLPTTTCLIQELSFGGEQPGLMGSCFPPPTS